LDHRKAKIVLDSLRHVSSKRGWHLLAAHIRTTHAHAVIQADRPPEFVMTALKGAASVLLDADPDERRGQRRWARHGSTRYLFTGDAIVLSMCKENLWRCTNRTSARYARESAQLWRSPRSLSERKIFERRINNLPAKHFRMLLILCSDFF